MQSQPRDAKGRFVSLPPSAVDIAEATNKLEQLLKFGLSEEIVNSSEQLAALVHRIPTLTPAQATRISTIIKPPNGDPIPTDIWEDLDRACRNALSEETSAQ